MKKALLLFTLSLLSLSCSSDDNSPVQPSSGEAENILYIHARPNSFLANYDMLFNGETIHGQLGQVSSDFHKLVNANLVTYFKVQARTDTEIRFHLNQSNIPETLIEEGKCYELIFTTDENGVVVLDGFIEADCHN